MKSNILVIISHADKESCRTGLMYALNARKHKWTEEVKLIFFGPSQETLLIEEELQELLKEYLLLGSPVLVCKYFAEEKKNEDALKSLHLQSEYVGEIISQYINDGYIPLIW